MRRKGGRLYGASGKNIKLLRTSRNMTQDDLAELLFVSRQTVSNYETGKSNPDIDMLVKIAAVLKTDPNSLIYGISKPQNRKKEWVRLCVAAGILTVLAAAVLILTPIAKEIGARRFLLTPSMLIGLVLKPCMFLLSGWVIMQAIFLIFGIKPLQQNCIKWIHWAIVGIAAAYFVIIGPFLIQNIYCSIVTYMGHRVHSDLNLGPVWNWLMMRLTIFSSRYSAVFIIAGIFLRATKPQRAAPTQTSSGEI